MLTKKLKTKWEMAVLLSKKQLNGEHQILAGAAVIFTSYALTIFPWIGIPVEPSDILAWIILTLVWFGV